PRPTPLTSALYPYTTLFRSTLRALWEEKILKENPDLEQKQISRPIVTNALTHGLSILADLFVNAGDTLLLPVQNWGNYKLIFNTDRKSTRLNSSHVSISYAF